MATKKPGDETLRGVPPRLGLTDTYDGSLTPSGSHKAVSGEAAPEVSQGAWRERVFTPRAVLPLDDIVRGLEDALRVCLSSANHPRVAFQEVRKAWMPFLRQAVEQAGGDGLDAWLLAILKLPGKLPNDKLLLELNEALGRMRASRDLAGFEEEALKVMDVVRRGGGAKKLSFKQMEQELEGKLEVDELMAIVFSDESELVRQLEEIGASMETLRAQLRLMPGKQPDGMYANFVRLKASVRVIGAELKRRSGAK